MKSTTLLAIASILALIGASGCGGSTNTSGNANNAGGGSGDDNAGGGGGDVDSGVSTGPADGSSPTPDGSTGAPVDGGAFEAVALNSCIPTVYTAPTTIGGSQTFQLLFDTGSTSLGVAAKGCSCGGVNPLYSPGSSAVDEKQTAQAQFGTGSWSGEIYQDNVSVGSSPTASTKLVAINQEQSFFEPIQCDSTSGGTQGVLGFGPSASAVAGTTGFFDQYVAANGAADVFAVELCETTGNLWLGGFDPAATTAAPQYTPLAADITSQYYYTVNLASVTVGGTTVNTTSGSPLPDYVVDTGTSAFLLNSTAYTALAAAIQADAGFKGLFGSSFFPAAGTQNLACAAVTQTKAQLDAALPALTLTFGSNPGISVKAVATESYLFNYQNQWCATLLGIDQNTLGPLAGILGAPVMRSNVVIFDRAQKRIGFAPHAACN